MKENNNKEANSIIDDNTLNSIKTDIEYVLENVACLGRDAYGAYNDKMKEFLVLTIKKAIMEERIKAQQEIKSAITEAIDLLELDPYDPDLVLKCIEVLQNTNY